jgi:hypothetical protein
MEKIMLIVKYVINIYALIVQKNAQYVTKIIAMKSINVFYVML